MDGAGGGSDGDRLIASGVPIVAMTTYGALAMFTFATGATTLVGLWLADQ